MGYTYAKQSAIYLNFEFNWVSFIFIAKSGFCKQGGSLSFRDAGSERDPTFPLHPSPPVLRLLDLALFPLSAWQVVTRGSEGGNPKEMQSSPVTSCHPDQVGHQPGDLDTFLGLASHSHFRSQPHCGLSLWPRLCPYSLPH